MCPGEGEEAGALCALSAGGEDAHHPRESERERSKADQSTAAGESALVVGYETEAPFSLHLPTL